MIWDGNLEVFCNITLSDIYGRTFSGGVTNRSSFKFEKPLVWVSMDYFWSKVIKWKIHICIAYKLRGTTRTNWLHYYQVVLDMMDV